jgi:uncharacterized membrane protein
MLCTHCNKDTLTAAMRFCPECGKEIADAGNSGDGDNSTDGVRSSPQVVRPRRSPLSPHLSLLNLLCPGVAQIVFGQVAKGIAFVVVAVLALPTLGFVNLILCIVSTIDGYCIGSKLRRGLSVKKWEFF